MGSLHAPLALLRRAGRVALDAVLPPQCLACGLAVTEPRTLCAACWAGIVWLGPPLCACCGLPFEYAPELPGEGRLLCGGCIAAPPAFDRARAVFAYDDTSRALILGFKHADRTHAAPAFGLWLARAGAELIEQADIIAPVPLHWTRLALRRYNQSAMLAAAVAKLAKRPLIPDLLSRTRRTPSQGGLDAAGRRKNVRRAFALAERHRERIEDARVLVIDDVFTTGATLAECARTLKAAGAAAVDALALARVVRPAPDIA
jgi:ComF family protein